MTKLGLPTTKNLPLKSTQQSANLICLQYHELKATKVQSIFTKTKDLVAIRIIVSRISIPKRSKIAPFLCSLLVSVSQLLIRSTIFFRQPQLECIGRVEFCD